MKEQFILWTGGIIITFLVIYFQNVTGDYYPATGTIGIEGKKVTFKLDRIHRGNSGYNVIIRKDTMTAEAFLLWKKSNQAEWNKNKLNDSLDFYSGFIPSTAPKANIDYRIELLKNGKKYLLPLDNPVQLTFLGKVPSTIMILYCFFLFGGLLLAVRGGLEFFNKNKKTKVYAMFTTIFFFAYTIVVTPLKTSYELNAIGNSVPPIQNLFNLQSLLLFLLSVTGMVIIISSKKTGIKSLILSLVMIIIYLLFPIIY